MFLRDWRLCSTTGATAKRISLLILHRRTHSRDGTHGHIRSANQRISDLGVERRDAHELNSTGSERKNFDEILPFAFHMARRT